MVQKNCVKSKIVIISGPTAIGKSAVAVEVAKKIGGEIISADSMQIYKGLNIGTGKITMDEMQGIEHYLLDIIEPYDEYSVSEFVKDAKKYISQIEKRNKIPILTGGTGLYLNALINGFSFSNVPKSEEIRNSLNDVIEKEGLEILYNKLSDIDPVSAEKISKNDKKRIVRALEIFYLSANPKSKNIDNIGNSDFDYLFLVIHDERQKIYDRINLRVEKMFANGLIDEVKSLMAYKNSQSMQAIGYKEVVQYLENKLDYEDVISKVKQNSRHYAKRQLTYLRWLKADKYWHNVEDSESYYKLLSKFV